MAEDTCPVLYVMSSGVDLRNTCRITNINVENKHTAAIKMTIRIKLSLYNKKNVFENTIFY